jgi:hypothetical protein
MARSAGLLAKENMLIKTAHTAYCMEDVHVRECLVIHSAGHVAIKHTNDTLRTNCAAENFLASPWG